MRLAGKDGGICSRAGGAPGCGYWLSSGQAWSAPPAVKSSGIFRSQQPTAILLGSRPARTATSGSPKLSANQIGRITTAGVITEFPIPRPSTARRITAGPDGNLWFTEEGANQIGRITTAGVITEFSIPTAGSLRRYHGRPGRQPLVHRIFCQPDRPDHHRRRRHRVPVPTAGSRPWCITAGPDGNLWFTETRRQQDRPDHHRRVITEFPDSRRPASPQASPPARTATSGSPNSTANRIGRITPAGVITEFPIPHGRSGPAGITAGPDGNLWFTESGRQPDRPDHPGRRDHRVPDPHAGVNAGRHHGGPRRQPLVHRRTANQIGRITTGPCAANDMTLCLSSNRFRVTADFETQRTIERERLTPSG